MTSEAFNPSTRDNLLLSTLRESVGPHEAHRRWTDDLGYKSVGTFGVSVEEIDGTEQKMEEGESFSLYAIDDASPVRPDHASVVFQDMTKGQRKQAARKLRDHALERGCLYQP